MGLQLFQKYVYHVADVGGAVSRTRFKCKMTSTVPRSTSKVPTSMEDQSLGFPTRKPLDDP